MTSWLSVSLHEFPGCFEGIIPSTICTVAPDGTPNITYLSVVHLVDETHVALSRQFFAKTDENTVRNPMAQIGLVEPQTGRAFQLDVVYERTETEGELFEKMRARLDAVAAHEGMANVFQLRGADICRVYATRMLPCDYPEGPPPQTVSIARVEAGTRRVAAAIDMEDLLRATLSTCYDLGYEHAFLMLVDESGERLYTVASAGFAASGTGSEVRLGDGIIGVSAARRIPVRVTHMARDLRYLRAAREPFSPDTSPGTVEQVIPLPSLPSVQSQLVTPMLAHRQLVGVLCLQSDVPGAFSAEDECALSILSNQVAVAMSNLRPGEVTTPGPSVPLATPPHARTVQVKHYVEDDSIFLDNEYLIKGVAGGILWRLLKQYQDEQRVEFSNKEIRLDQSLDLPDIKDNLEARLILLRKRVEERCDYIRIEKVARGRFRLAITRPLALVEVQGGGPM